MEEIGGVRRVSLQESIPQRMVEETGACQKSQIQEQIVEVIETVSQDSEFQLADRGVRV